MSDAWSIANLRDEIEINAAALAGLLDKDACDGLEDADMRTVYREGVDAVRMELMSLI